MKGKKSKNSPDNKNNTIKYKMVTSYECEICNNKCLSGLAYLKSFAIKKEGNGVMCYKK